MDPKSNNFFFYSNSTLFKPNLKEVKEGLGMDKLESLVDIENAAKLLHKKMNLSYVMITLGEMGIIIYDGVSTHYISAHNRKIIDVSGAGDTVISIAALCIIQKLDYKSIAEISNLAGGIVCEEVGVVSINKLKLNKEYKKLKNYIY